MRASNENLRKYIVNNYTIKEVLNASRKLNRLNIIILIIYFSKGTKELSNYLEKYFHTDKEKRLVRKCAIISFLKLLDIERNKRI